ncbi:hypothetical protein DPMN_170585 [Dreissena polymorpha]|uniref:Uncharacterized protein n=1 Tax=Dreissena polymorpha TaxID=45954 RepID=A0A9D4DZJ6_DREPO|nr:hypothetical protein DPMN_170585 [Dreissena polymorpha]
MDKRKRGSKGYDLSKYLKLVTNFEQPVWLQFPVINHAFDSLSQRGKRQRKSKRSDISKPHEVTRGCLSIRCHHKCDESKILPPTTRLCITLQDNMIV